MKLIFVYNANSGIVNTLLDSAHKIVSPATYNCNLCAITFGVFSENTEWKNFKESSDLEMVFLHKDEFLKQYKSKWLPAYNFPIILVEGDKGLEVFISNEKINKVETASELIGLIKYYL